MTNEKEKILLYATDKFHSNGFHKTSIDELAEDMHISKKTIYKHFPTKEKLVEECTESMLSRAQVKVREIVDSKEDVITKFVKLLEMYSEEISKVSDKWVRDLQVHTPEIWQKIDSFRTKNIYNVSRKLLNQGKKESFIENLPPEIVIESYVASIRAIVSPDFIIKNNFSMQEALHYFFDMQLKGVLTEKGRKKYVKCRKNIKQKRNLE